MMNLLRWIALALAVLTLNSCMIPKLLGRTVGNVVNQLGRVGG